MKKRLLTDVVSSEQILKSDYEDIPFGGHDEFFMLSQLLLVTRGSIATR